MSEFTVVVMKAFPWVQRSPPGGAAWSYCLAILREFRIVMANCYCQEKCLYRMHYRVGSVVVATILVVVSATIGACATPTQRTQQLARSGGLTPLSLRGTIFQHQGFAAARGTPGLLVLFIEGDGSPWVDGSPWIEGLRPAADPTARVPLALELAVATPASVLYLERPCYLQTTRPPECSEALWTSRRYSAEVVASMTAAAAGFIADHHFERVLVVGYSGGGTIAALMAKDLPHLSGLVTIAGNLDPETWTQLHGYLPLEGSLNPALEPPLPPQLKQWYLVGQRDSNVPASATARYFARVPPGRVWSYALFDHKCCWKREWPSIFAKILAESDH
jgi:pimeloyl-ACP methyl ester carboxylesterase